MAPEMVPEMVSEMETEMVPEMVSETVPDWESAMGESKVHESVYSTDLPTEHRSEPDLVNQMGTGLVSEMVHQMGAGSVSQMVYQMVSKMVCPLG